MGRTEKAIRNAKVGLTLQILQIFAQFACRTVFIRSMPAEYLGVNGIFQNILNILQMAELGFGSAFACSLYGPLKDNDTEEISGIVKFFKYIYYGVALVILLLGLQIIPFMGYLIKDMNTVPNMMVYYILNLVGVVGQYLFVYNALMIEADQKQYITSMIQKGLALVKNIVQMISLVVLHSFLIYLIIQVVFDIGQNAFIGYKAKKMYPYINKSKAKVKSSVKHKIMSDVKDIVFHRMGGILMNYTDQLILSSVQGLTSVALYSNYQLVTQNLKTLLRVPFESTRAGFGNLQATDDLDKLEQRLLDVQFICMTAYGYVAQTLVVVFNQFIEVWAGKDYVFSIEIVFWIVLAFYLDGIRQPVTITKETMGVFHADKYREFICAVINLILQIAFVIKYGIVGVFAGTVISLLITTQFIEPLVLYKNGLKRQSFKFWVLYVRMSAITVLQGCVGFISVRVLEKAFEMNAININGVILFILYGMMCTIIYSIICCVLYPSKVKMSIELVKKIVQK